MNLTNILGTISAVVAIAMSILTDFAKCSADAAGVVTCGASWLTPAMAGYAVLLFSGILLVSKVIRPGGPLRGLFGSTAVIVPAEKLDELPTAKGVVTPSQVAASK